MSTNLLRKVVLPVVIVLAGAAVFVAMVKMRPQPEKEPHARPRPVIETFTVAHGNAPIEIRAYGSVKAKRSISLVPQVGGEVVVKSQAFEAGASCRAGEILLEIDDTDYVLAHEQAKANVAKAELDLARAEQEATIALREWKRLQAGNPDTPAPTALVLHEPQLKLARASLESARAAGVQARTNLERCRVRAPFDGRILTADVDAGQYLRPGTSVGTLHAIDVAEVTVSIPDDDLAWITVAGSDAEGDAATTVDVTAEFSGAVHHWAGRSVRLGGAVDPRSRLVPVVVEIDDPFSGGGGRPAMFEGMFVETIFSTDPPHGAVLIPRAALRPDGKVWVVTPDTTLSIRGVTVARAGVNSAVVSSGLAPGDRVCTSNLQIVTEGLPVRLTGSRSNAEDPPRTGEGGPQ